MFDLTRFPVSDGAGVKCYTFCTILDRFFFEFLSSHGNVGNCMLNRMEALPGASGTCLTAERGSEGQKSLFFD